MAGLALDPDGERIYFSLSYGNSAAAYRLPLGRPEHAAAELVRLYEPAGLFGAGHIAFGASGKLYVVLLGANQVSILRPDGTEELRFPSAEQNAQQEVPWDDPLFVAFDGAGSLLVTNDSFPSSRRPDWSVVFDTWVNDTASPLARPSIP